MPTGCPCTIAFCASMMRSMSPWTAAARTGFVTELGVSMLNRLGVKTGVNVTAMAVEDANWLCVVVVSGLAVGACAMVFKIVVSMSSPSPTEFSEL